LSSRGALQGDKGSAVCPEEKAVPLWANSRSFDSGGKKHAASAQDDNFKGVIFKGASQCTPEGVLHPTDKPI
jgi:hypothetical protein